MHKFTDIHAHSRRGRDIVTSVEAGEPLEGDYGTVWFSVGIHPWSTAEPIPESKWEALEASLLDPRVVAVGECGLDKNRGGSPEVQEEVFKRQAFLADAAGLPLIIHCVGRYGRLIELHRLIDPASEWIVHGFSGKPELARQLLQQGINISLGRRANPDVAAVVPPHRLYHETDD